MSVCATSGFPTRHCCAVVNQEEGHPGLLRLHLCRGPAGDPAISPLHATQPLPLHAEEEDQEEVHMLQPSVPSTAGVVQYSALFYISCACDQGLTKACLSTAHQSHMALDATWA